MKQMTRQILGLIAGSIAEHGYPPSLRELAQATGMASHAGAKYHLDLLEAAGLIERDKGVSRGIRIVKRRGK